MIIELTDIESCADRELGHTIFVNNGHLPTIFVARPDLQSQRLSKNCRTVVSMDFTLVRFSRAA